MPTTQMAAQVQLPMFRVASPPPCPAVPSAVLSYPVGSLTASVARVLSRLVPSSGALDPSSRALLRISLCSSSVVSSTVSQSVSALLKSLSTSPNWLLLQNVDVLSVRNNGPLPGVRYYPVLSRYVLHIDTLYTDPLLRPS